MTNKFANALKKKEQSNPVVFDENNIHISDEISIQKQSIAPSRVGVKHIGGYFDPIVSRQLKSIAIDEERSVQALVAEALDMLFQSRGKPMIAEKAKHA